MGAPLLSSAAVAAPGDAAALTCEGRRRLARATWCSELLTLLLTAIYCAIFAHDLAQTSDEFRISSPSWFSRGFCISWAESGFTSHSLCFLGDLVGGGALVRANLRRYSAAPESRYQVAVVVSWFTVMHGFGHLMIDQLLERDFMSFVRPQDVPIAMTVLYFATAALLLAMGPFLGYVNGAHRYLCVSVHLMAAWAFVAFVPTHFVFGFVQLYLNAWYCTPRILLLGCSTPEEMARRVDDGWNVVSFGFLALMPVVFAEMLACDAAVMTYGGHFLYDGMIIVLAYIYSATLWQGGADGATAKAAVVPPGPAAAAPSEEAAALTTAAAAPGKAAAAAVERRPSPASSSSGHFAKAKAA